MDDHHGDFVTLENRLLDIEGRERQNVAVSAHGCKILQKLICDLDSSWQPVIVHTNKQDTCLALVGKIVGKPGQRWHDMYKASRDGLNAAKEKIKPGAVSHDVDRAARETINKAGFGTYFMHRTGYSIGIGFPPDWGEGRIISLNENDPTVLEAGMPFHPIPHLKGLNEGGVVCSESLVVTDTGYRLLTEYPQDVVLK